MIKIEDLDLDIILTDKKLYENIIAYNFSHKNLNNKPLRIRLDKIDGFIRVSDGTRYLVLFGSKKYNPIYNRIRYFMSVKSGITYIIFHNYAKAKVDSYYSLPLEETITFNNVVILIKSVWNKAENDYYYNIFLEKASYDSPKKYVFLLNINAIL